MPIGDARLLGVRVSSPKLCQVLLQFGHVPDSPATKRSK
jgi:hypothetical protein